MTLTTEGSEKIFVAGGSGLVGSAIARRLQSEKSDELLLPGSKELDLRNQDQVEDWFRVNKPTHVYLVAGTVGGILANSTRPAEFIYDNLMIHANVINASQRYAVKKLLYLGSSCIYPRDANQPIREEYLLNGPLEPTNEWYAIAKISGIKMCQAYRRQYGANFISAMPTNLYGPKDNFSPTSGHVLPALMRKFHMAKEQHHDLVEIWGSGTPLREFLHVDDLADACVFLMKHYDGDAHVNIGSGEEVSIRELAETVRDVVYPQASLVFDKTKPDGTPRKLLDVSRLRNLGWAPKVSLHRGVRTTYDWFLHELENGRIPRGMDEGQ